MKVGLYPGSFDPITNGHLDIIERAAQLFEVLYVTVFRNTLKAPLFTVEERMAMIAEATAHIPNVMVDQFDGLLVNYARGKGARVIIKGLRAVSDFEYEFQMAQMNKKLEPGVETLFMMTSSKYSYLSSRIIKEISFFGGCVDGLVPGGVARRLNQKFREGKIPGKPAGDGGDFS